MELKLISYQDFKPVRVGLNRTFYGIETLSEELPHGCEECLNRTFYGIETSFRSAFVARLYVLIVPFMELKLRYIEDGNLMITGLNRTFYGIETRKRTGKGDADGRS